VENKAHYTRCPHCKSAFRITLEILSRAQGKARCGACLAIFQASDYLLQPKEVKEVLEEAAQEDSQDSKSNASVNNTFEVIENSEIQKEQDEFEFDPETGDLVLPEDKKDLVAEVKDEPQEEFQGKSIETETEESVPLENDVNSSRKEPTFEIDINDIDPNDIDLDGNEVAQPVEKIKQEEAVQPSEDESSEVDEALSVNKASEVETDTSKNLEISEEQLDIEDVIQASASEAESITTSEEDETAVESEAKDDQDAVSQDEEAQEEAVEEIPEKPEEDEELKRLLEASKKESEKPKSREEILKAVDVAPDPLEEFDEIVQPNKRTFRNWLIFIVILSQLAFAGYKFWTNRQTLAWDENWGEFTQKVCSYLDCQLEARRDVSKIRLRQRIVSPSEEKEGYLSIQMLLTNEAEFDQPYPQILIRFSNSQGDQVAEKQFAVKDYFPEKVNELMPADAEVHISFETELPHPDALGFEFIFN